MHGEQDALPVNGDSSLFVAATLAALVLAGSALVYRKTCEQQPERGKLTQPFQQSTPDDMDTEKHQPLDVHGCPDSPSSTHSTHDPDSKESKSSRSKDRRRRGKDPLREILKGGKKLKSTPSTPFKQSFVDKPILDDPDNHHHNHINNIPTSFVPTTPNSFSRSSGQRVQEDDSLFSLPAASVGTASSVHSRTTSEVSQSSTGSKILDPHQHIRDRTASSTSIFDDPVLTPSQASSSSLSHNGTEGNTSIPEQRNPDIILSRQTPETHLAVPTPTIFSTNTDDFSDILNHSGPSSATNTTTASCVITPATSPSLSYTASSKLVPAPSPVGADSKLVPNKGSDSDCGPKNNLVSEPSHARDTDTKSRNISRKQQPFPSPSPSKSRSKSKTNAPNPWEWDNTGETALASSAPVIASAPSSSSAAPAFPPDTPYRKPPRLQSKSLWSKNAKNNALSPIPGSVSHPSLLSPTSGSFLPPDSPLLSPSISLSLEKAPNSVSKVAEEGEIEEVEEWEGTNDSYMQLEFPTLNPIVSTSSSLASTGGGDSTASSSAAGPSNNHRPTTPRRVRGPPTPSDSASPHLNSGFAQPPPTQIPAVSTQTQLASLRGALEAARLREEKHKVEMERCTKELEALRWENVNARRGEVELQNYIRHLMHQLQIYASLVAGVSPSPASQQQQTQGPMSSGSVGPGDRAAPGSSSGPTSPGTQNVQSLIPGPSPSMHLHMLPPLSLNGLSSPLSASSLFSSPMSNMHAPSPYLPYPIPPVPLHPHTVMPSPHPMFAQQFHHMQQQFLQFQQYQQQQPRTQNQSQSPTIQAQQANLISMLQHPPSLATNSSHRSAASSSSSMASGSRPSSRLGTESAGSSPDLNGSPSPAPGSKRRTRIRTQTANGYFGAAWNGTSDGWVVGSVGIDEGGPENIYEYEEGESGDGCEDEGGYNELLADAIFKRPDHLGVRKKSKQPLLETEMEEEKSKDRELEQLENEVLDAVEPLKFPSLSDLGNVHNNAHITGHSRSSSCSSSAVFSPTPEELGPNISDLQELAKRPLSDIVHAEATVSENGVESENRNENQLTLDTASCPESERTPRREEAPNVTQPLMDLNGVKEATELPEGQ